MEGQVVLLPCWGKKKLADIWRLSLLSPLRAEVRKCVDNLDSSGCSGYLASFRRVCVYL